MEIERPSIPQMYLILELFSHTASGEPRFDGIPLGTVQAAIGEKNSGYTQRKELGPTLLPGSGLSLADKYLFANFLTHTNTQDEPTLCQYLMTNL